MNAKTPQILKEVLERIRPPKEDIEFIEKSLKEFVKKIEDRKKKLKIKIETFVGGSYAKKTLIKKDKYDIDIFLRFNKNQKDISESARKLLNEFKGVKIVHGSRDYFRIKIRNNLFFEIVPVKKVNNPKEAENITDLSYSHVKYLNKKIKSKKILEDIMIAKAFCHAKNCYGAESYINGFSGYGLELLVYYYKGFMKFIQAIAKVKDKEVIDIEKHHKNKSAILMDINESKLQSLIILIDPTFKQRNALAALSKETFLMFQKECRKFLKKPTIKAFEKEKVDLDKIKKDSKKNDYEFVLLKISTDKPEGDVAGSKMIKFYRHLGEEIDKFFEIKRKGFEYNEEKSAECFFVVKKKKEILIKGPFVDDKTNVQKFKKKHKNTFVKGKKICVREKINFGIIEFIQGWKKKNTRKIKEMYVDGLRVV